MSTVTAPAAQVAAPANRQTYRAPFAIMTVLFFMWGFMTSLNDILNARFKDAFQLSNFQSAFVQSAFFGAYGIGSLVYYIVSTSTGDPINRIGYKNGVVIGLFTTALGTSLFFPAATLESYPCFLAALFIVGLGLTMLQIAANPYVTILGPERTASSRLNLSQAFNSVGHTISPIIGAVLIFKIFDRPGVHGAESVKIPYLCFAGVFAALAVLFLFAHVPAFTNHDKIERGVGALKHPHTLLGMLAIFFYVGGEVTVGNNVIILLGTADLGGLPRSEAANYLAYYWGGLMIGRFMGAFALSEMRAWLKRLLVVLVPVTAFGLILVLPAIAGALHLDWAQKAGEVCSFDNVRYYGLLLVALVIAFIVGAASPQRMLALFSAIIISLLATGILSAGVTAKWAILGVGLFCSVMWSNIFSLAIEGLGALKGQASSLLVMAIVGGAVLPPLQGKLADLTSVQTSFIVPMLAFAYVAFYGIYGYRAGRQSEPKFSN